ncbi:eukaryotic mitochondrial regulator protein-domain-containing protein [Schizophyllum commune]
MLSRVQVCSRALRSASQSSSRPVRAGRRICTTAVRRAEDAPPPVQNEPAIVDSEPPEAVTEAPRELPKDDDGEQHIPRTYKEFMQTVGQKYRNVDINKKNNWLSADRLSPFPMNPSFRPPPPISDAKKELMWTLFQQDPDANSQLNLSRKFGVSLKRVDAILRLKGLEHDLKSQEKEAGDKVQTPLVQTGFQKGMEVLLGSEQAQINANKYALQSQPDPTYYNQSEADQLELEENRDAQRQRYVRMYWESIPEDGREPVVPAALKHAQEKAIEHSQKAERAKEKLVPKIPETFELRRPEKMQVIQAREKAPLEFKDVGAKFLDVERELQRLKTSQTKRRKRASVAQAVNTAVPPRANLS